MADDKNEQPVPPDCVKKEPSAHPDTQEEDSLAPVLRQAIRDEFAFLGAERVERVTNPTEKHSPWLLHPPCGARIWNELRRL